MSFSYFDNDKQIQKIDIQVGGKWADYQTSNEKLNSIFKEVDDGDGIVQITEKAMVDDLIKQADNQIESTANNNFLEDEELQKFDITFARLKQSFDTSYFTADRIKTYYPEDKYTYTQEGRFTVVTDKETGKKVIEYTAHGYINEYSANGSSYNVKINGIDVQITHSSLEDDRDKTLGFRNGTLNMLYDHKNKIRLGWRENIEREILFKNLENPEWLRDNAMNELSKMPPNVTVDFLQKYYDRNKEFLLTKIYCTEGVSAETKEKIFALLDKLEVHAGYKPEMTNENSQVKTEFYKSDTSYSVNFSDDIVTVKANKPDAKEYKIDLNKLMIHVPLDIRPYAKAAIQQMPGETLVDLAIECDKFGSPIGRDDFHGNTAGSFDSSTDMISFGFTSIKVKPATIIHELGHAVDHRKYDRNEDVPENWKYDFSILRNPKLKEAYFKSKIKYLGVEQYYKIDSETGSVMVDDEGLMQAGYLSKDKKWTSKYYRLEDKAYMYTDVLEGPSELYLLAMTGESENTPKEAVTPELMEEYLKSLKAARDMTETERHIREK